MANITGGNSWETNPGAAIAPNEGRTPLANYALPSNLSGGITFSAPSMTIGADGGITSSGGLAVDLPMSTISAFGNAALNYAATNSAGNQAFLGNVITTQQQHTTQLANTVNQTGRAIADQTYGLANQAIKETANLGWWKAVLTKCYITTAICRHAGMPDDNRILKTFRAFRDVYMLTDERRAGLVAEYYETAPEIALALSDMPDTLELLRVAYLMPAYHAIIAGDYVQAETLYANMVAAAKQAIKGE